MGLREHIEEQRHKLREIELEIEEADLPTVPAKVNTPSPNEYNRHCATHLPYRIWCPICAQAKKRKSAREHNASDRVNKHVPAIDMNEITDDTNNSTL